MRSFEFQSDQVHERDSGALLAPPGAAQSNAFLWISLTRDELRDNLAAVQQALLTIAGTSLVELHVSDLLNEQLPSHYDATSIYDLLVLRRLAIGPAGTANANAPGGETRRSGPPVLRHIDTRPIGFAVFDRVLLSVHPEGFGLRDAYASKLRAANGNGNGAAAAVPVLDARTPNARLPSSPADLMLRLASQIVDAYLDLRRDLTRQLDHWQTELVDPHSRFTNWTALLQARQGLHHLDEICEDQRAAVQDWIDALETLPAPEDAAARRERELVMVRSRDVHEHIERVVHHVRRLEQNAETAVQMHFSVQSHRTNDIMRVLTVLTAIFLPLNLIAGIFGMNFEFIPLVHKTGGFWIAMAAMGGIALALVLLFWRKRYLARSTD